MPEEEEFVHQHSPVERWDWNSSIIYGRALPRYMWCLWVSLWLIILGIHSKMEINFKDLLFSYQAARTSLMIAKNTRAIAIISASCRHPWEKEHFSHLWKPGAQLHVAISVVGLVKAKVLSFRTRINVFLFAVECKWGEWSDWGQCSKPCGGGNQERTRSVDQQAEYGGTACSGKATETRGCNAQACTLCPDDNESVSCSGLKKFCNYRLAAPYDTYMADNCPATCGHCEKPECNGRVDSRYYNNDNRQIDRWYAYNLSNYQR